MEFNEPLYRPREYYETMLKNQYHETAISYFNDLAQAASVDEAANAEHVRLYEEAMKEVEAARKKLGKVRAGKGWATAGVIISFTLAVLAIAIAATNLETMWYLFIAGGVLIGLGILFIVLICTKIKRAVAIANEELAAKEAVANEALKVCQLDMATLNASFDDVWTLTSLPTQTTRSDPFSRTYP